MRALKCDRCGKFYIPDDEFTGIIDGIRITRMGHVENFDICPSCAKSFVLWFKEVEMNIAKEAMTENELHSVVE